MTLGAYYNENDRFACDWLSNLMDAGLITPGKIDDRSIHDVRPDDLAGYERVHFFAGIGGWERALQLAGWRGPVWTGSCPCQPFSAAGKRKGFADDRHLWPQWHRLIRERRPTAIFGEQVTKTANWLALVRGDLEALEYAVGAIPIEAASVGANHRRDRFWFVAYANSAELRDEPGRRNGSHRESQAVTSHDGEAEALAHSNGSGWAPRHGDISTAGHGHSIAASGGDVADADASRPPERCEPQLLAQFPPPLGSGWWAVEPDVGRVAHGVPARVAKLRALGNAIVPQVAAEFIRASCAC